jgi:Holliday junction resolvase RusA-like endonuclease
MTQSDRWKPRPVTDRYWEFKDKLKALWGDRPIPNSMHLIFYIPMPKSWSGRRRAVMKGKPHQSKPDIDNLGKPLWMRFWSLTVASMTSG